MHAGPRPPPPPLPASDAQPAPRGGLADHAAAARLAARIDRYERRLDLLDQQLQWAAEATGTTLNPEQQERQEQEQPERQRAALLEERGALLRLLASLQERENLQLRVAAACAGAGGGGGEGSSGDGPTSSGVGVGAQRGREDGTAAGPTGAAVASTMQPATIHLWVYRGGKRRRCTTMLTGSPLLDVTRLERQQRVRVLRVAATDGAAGAAAASSAGGAAGAVGGGGGGPPPPPPPPPPEEAFVQALSDTLPVEPGQHIWLVAEQEDPLVLGAARAARGAEYLLKLQLALVSLGIAKRHAERLAAAEGLRWLRGHWARLADWAWRLLGP